MRRWLAEENYDRALVSFLCFIVGGGVYMGLRL